LFWRTFPEHCLSLSEGGAVATQTLDILDNQWSLTTTETELTEGKHYWEVELLSEKVHGILVGISRPNLDPTGIYCTRECTDGWFIYGDSGALCGNGKFNNDKSGAYKQGDRVGMLLDLDNGSLRFFKNSVENGPGYAAGSVTGPVVAAVQMCKKDARVQLLQDAETPANA
jgi:hypothetical protein